MTHVHQVVVGASPGDAVTESALCLRTALRQVVDADIFAKHVHPELEDDVLQLEELGTRRPSTGDVLINHITIGEAALADFLACRRERLIAVYHNITPGTFFREVDPEFAALLDHGRNELPRSLARADRVIADSEFNARELRRLGCAKPQVVTPPMRFDRLVELAPDIEMAEHIASRVHGKLLLFVGQPLPHKRPDLLISAFNLLTTNALPQAHLVIAGPTRDSAYEAALRRFASELALDNVWFTERLTDAELAACFRAADVFVTASEHEGFCVPIVEAFAFGVPVVARDFGAVADTAGGAALVLPSDSGAPELAEALHRVLTDETLRSTLTARGLARADEFRPERTLAPMLQVVLGVLQESAGP